MSVRFNAVEEAGCDGPFIAESDVIGLYRAEVAIAAASRSTVPPLSAGALTRQPVEVEA